jgi:glucose-6-phosphate isomerase
LIDYSKHLVDDHVMRRLLPSPARPVSKRRAAMFAGQPINVTERRAVLHTALRAPRMLSSRSMATTSSTT